MQIEQMLPTTTVSINLSDNAFSALSSRQLHMLTKFVNWLKMFNRLSLFNQNAKEFAADKLNPATIWKSICPRNKNFEEFKKTGILSDCYLPGPCDCREKFTRLQYDTLQDVDELCLYDFRLKEWTTKCCIAGCNCRDLSASDLYAHMDQEGLCLKKTDKWNYWKKNGLSNFRLKILSESHSSEELESYNAIKYDMHLHHLLKLKKELISAKIDSTDLLAHVTCRAKSQMIKLYFELTWSVDGSYFHDCSFEACDCNSMEESEIPSFGKYLESHCHC